MKRYLYETTVNTGSGIQIWYIDAETKEEADEMAENSDFHDIYDEEIQVNSCGDPWFVGETEITDFGMRN